MRRISSVTSIVVVLAGILSLRGTSHAQTFEAYLKIGDWKGEVTDPQQYVDWIEALSYSHRISNPVDPQNPIPGGRSMHEEFRIVKSLDRTTPLIALAVCNGNKIDTVTLILTKRDPEGVMREYMEYKMEGVIISMVSPGAAQAIAGSAGSAPIEEVAFVYEKITWKYTPRKPDGTPDAPVETSWDVTQNAPAKPVVEDEPKAE